MKTFISFIFLMNTAFGMETFLSSMQPNSQHKTYDELKDIIKNYALRKNTYLSLGESHLESSTAIQINYDLMTTFLNNVNQKTVFCSETLDHFLGVYGDSIQKQVNRYKIFEGNSPYKTDFSQCRGGGKNYITYSGFFHQYPFARPFPKEFPSTPVVSENDNNIHAQMGKLDGLFITQAELEWLEFSSTKAILESHLDKEKFRAMTKKMVANVEELERSMDTVLTGDSIYSTKDAVVVSSRDFKVDLNNESEAYFLITNLNYRTSRKPLKVLSRMASLSDEELEGFLKKLKSSKFRVVNVLIGPDSQGEMGNVSFPGINRTFEGGTTFIEIFSESDHVIMAMERSSEDFICLENPTNREVPCF